LTKLSLKTLLIKLQLKHRIKQLAIKVFCW